LGGAAFYEDGAAADRSRGCCRAARTLVETIFNAVRCSSLIHSSIAMMMLFYTRGVCARLLRLASLTLSNVMETLARSLALSSTEKQCWRKQKPFLSDVLRSRSKLSRSLSLAQQGCGRDGVPSTPGLLPAVRPTPCPGGGGGGGRGGGGARAAAGAAAARQGRVHGVWQRALGA
jgi:hypothetical protein